MERTRNQRYQILLAFFLSLMLTLALPSLLLTFFAPFLVIVMYKRRFLITLAWALFCGLIMDCFSGYPLMGIHSISYCLAATVIRTQRQNFFDYHASTLPVMSFFFAMTATLSQWALLNSYGDSLKPTFKWLVTDLLVYPLFDALYAYLVFTLPRVFMPRSPKHEYFF